MESYQFDLSYKREENFFICGGDEVGRGALAGPVVVAMVIMDLNISPHREIKDSKKLSPKKRRVLSDWIKKNSICYSVAEVNNVLIDKINILESTKLAFTKAYEKLAKKPSLILFDSIIVKSIGVQQKSIIKGDNLSYSIASASILAKVYRDDLMNDYDQLYPNYFFNRHKGYGTRLHLDCIDKNGSTPIHRLTFKPLSKK